MELQVARVCEEFCGENDIAEDLHFSSEQLVYATSVSNPVYREIDQRVQYYEEFEIGEHLGIQLATNLPIECKHRDDLELFAFPTSNEGHRGFPILSELSGSQHFRSLREDYQLLSSWFTARIAGLEIKKGETPQKLHKEDLVYKAGGGLYDFVLFDSQALNSDGQQTDSALDQLGLFEEFQAYLAEHRYAWWSVLRRWIKDVGDDRCVEYNKLRFARRRIYEMVSAHFPIVCVNGPIYRVSWTTENGIEGYEEVPGCVATLRKTGWPGGFAWSLLQRTPEVPVLVTNSTGLKDALLVALKWHQAAKARLSNSDAQLLTRCPLESALFSKIYNHFAAEEEDSGYRSDRDTMQWI